MAVQTVNVVEKTNSTGFPRDFTVASTLAISKGLFVKLVDPRTASGAVTTGDLICGLTNEDVNVNGQTGQTNLTVLTDFIGDAVASGAISVGQPVQIEKDNYVKAISDTISGAVVANLGAATIGYALETASDAERIEVRFRL